MVQSLISHHFDMWLTVENPKEETWPGNVVSGSEAAYCRNAYIKNCVSAVIVNLHFPFPHIFYLIIYWAFLKAYGNKNEYTQMYGILI